MPSLKPENESPPKPFEKVDITYRPPDSLPHLVSDGENWTSLGARYKVDPKVLIKQNFKTDDPYVVNWYLREHVKCDTPTPDRYNWRFSTSSRRGGGPRAGVIFITPNWYAIESAARLLTTRWLNNILRRAWLKQIPVSNSMLVTVTGQDIFLDLGMPTDFVTSLGWQGATDDLARVWVEVLIKAAQNFVLATSAKIPIPPGAIPTNPLLDPFADIPMGFALPEWPLFQDDNTPPGLPLPEFLIPLGLPPNGAAAQAFTRFGQWWEAELKRIKENARAKNILGMGTYNYAAKGFTGTVQAQSGFLHGFEPS